MNGVLRSVNRVLLGLIGLVLLVLGGSVLAIGLGAPSPSWWIHRDRHDVLLTTAERTKWRDQGWWWPVVFAVLAVLVVLALWWLTRSVQRHRLSVVNVDTGDDEGAALRARALEGSVASEAADLDGVERVRVRLTGRRRTPRVRMRVRLEPDADPGLTLDRLTNETLAHARAAVGTTSLPSEIRMRAHAHRAERVS
ncbi:alkaline shock response membrane anchor protein AmaP [Streptomyces sp. NPDC056600]|uniref:alkaline shock response membrane anchor protein AmaP n=1 Tax=Streptomyces sp. NPDC056600 TaxID=3345874 RepID=UPI003687FD2D